jgi:hypothetical protein
MRMSKNRISIPLDGLGMDEVAMRELVNRMNEKDDRKWIFVKAEFWGVSQASNPLMAQQYYNQLANSFGSIPSS